MITQHLKHMSLFFVLTILSSLLFNIVSPSTADAARVLKAKGKKILIDMEGDDLEKGDILLTLKSSGKAAGIVKIRKVYPGKGQAIAILGKGKARKGMSLKKRRSKKRSKTAKKRRRKKRKKRSSSSDAYWGVMAGFAMDSMSVKIIDASDSNTEKTSSLSGSGFSLKGLFDYRLFDAIWFRGQAGVEAFAASSGDSFCGTDNLQTCDISIMYLAADLWGRYMITNSAMKLWVGGGFDLMFPLTKDATAIQDSSITNTSVPAVGLGIDWHLSSGTVIPIQFEYGMFPDSEDVSASFMAIRAGMAWKF